MNSIFRLGLFLNSKDEQYKSHFYRKKFFLEKKVSEIPLLHFASTEEEKNLINILSERAPLLPNDLENPSLQKILKHWIQIFPNDRNFFKMAAKQLKWLQESKDLNLRDFLSSPKAKAWIQIRSRFKHKARFELETFYRSMSQKALKREMEIKALIRDFPLLTFKDLKHLGVQNLQPIYERFPERELYRERFLEKLSLELKPQKKGSH